MSCSCCGCSEVQTTVVGRSSPEKALRWLFAYLQDAHGTSHMMEEAQRIRRNVDKLRVTIRSICSMLAKIEVDFRAAQMHVLSQR